MSYSPRNASHADSQSRLAIAGWKPSTTTITASALTARCAKRISRAKASTRKVVVRFAKITRVKASVFDHRMRSIERQERKKEGAKKRKRSSTKREAYSVNASITLSWLLSFFCVFDRDHLTNLLSNPRAILRVVTKIQNQLGWFWQRNFIVDFDNE